MKLIKVITTLVVTPAIISILATSAQSFPWIPLFPPIPVPPFPPRHIFPCTPNNPCPSDSKFVNFVSKIDVDLADKRSYFS